MPDAAPPDSAPEPSSQDQPDSGADPLLPRRFRAALCVYMVLAALAWITLDGVVRGATLLFLGGLAFKSWLGVLKDRQN